MPPPGYATDQHTRHLPRPCVTVIGGHRLLVRGQMSPSDFRPAVPKLARLSLKPESTPPLRHFFERSCGDAGMGPVNSLHDSV